MELAHFGIAQWRLSSAAPRSMVGGPQNCFGATRVGSYWTTAKPLRREGRRRPCRRHAKVHQKMQALGAPTYHSMDFRTGILEPGPKITEPAGMRRMPGGLSMRRFPT